MNTRKSHGFFGWRGSLALVLVFFCVGISFKKVLGFEKSGGEIYVESGGAIRREESLDKKKLSAAKEKLSSDLLKLVDDSYLLESQSRDQLVSEMKELKQFVVESDSTRRVDRKVENKKHGDLVYVYVYVNSGEPLSVINSVVWEVVDSDIKNNFVVALVEVDNLELLASLTEVRTVRTVMPPVVRSGSVVTEGDAIHQSDDVRSTYSQSGLGIKVGVISDGVDNMASAKSSGDLPAVVTVLGNAIGGDEGTAMLEIIYDMVPSANLYFHDCGSNVAAFNLAIDDLVSAGVDVIVDDIGWTIEPFFEDGTVASHVTSVLAGQNIVYVSAAGNDAQGHYQGNYYNDGSNYHDFARSATTNSYLYANIPNNGVVTVVLQWNDGFGSSSNNYDLYLYNTDGDGVLDSSTTIQNGNDDPLEYFSYTNSTGSSIVARIEVRNYLGSAATKTLEVFIHSSGGAGNYSNNITAVDSVYGHPAVPGAIAVGAIDASDVGNDTIEAFSSQGPVTIIGETQRSKPDISGIDGVSVTGAGGFTTPFSGTSAAAPHIAAIAAQLWGKYPLATGSQIRIHLLATSVDLGTAGVDNTFGYGRADALLAFQTTPSSIWYLAEGYTGGSFNTYVLLQNPNSTSATVDVTYMIEGESNVSKQYTVGANTRYTIDVNAAIGSGKSVSTQISANKNIIVERAMYWDGGGINWVGGHNTTGVTTPAATWYLAEGYTGGSFNTYVLLQNPNGTSATVDVTYMIEGESNVSKQYTVGANTRYTIDVNAAIGSGKSVSTQIFANKNIIVERAMYWDGGGINWVGGHNTTGITTPAATWYLAEGYTGGSFNTYVLLQNPNSTSATVDVTYMIEGESNVSKQYTVGANTRYTIDVNAAIGSGKSVSTQISANKNIIVERAMYWDGGGINWVGGHNTTGFN